ncbi:MAG TPA: S8 family serine peptidase [Pyrinomonadaceae bacterium]|nr:S8 family serine peptidase [Pyrinomonadaceae bacterium]
MFNCVKQTSVRLRFVFVLTIAAIAVALVVITPSSRAKVTQKLSSAAIKKLRRPTFVPGEVLVRYRTEGSAADKTNRILAAAASDGAQIEMRVEDFAGSKIVPGARIVRVAPERTLEAVQILRQQPDVMYAEPNYILHATATNPNDPLFGANPSGFPQWNLVKIGAPQAYDTIRGSKNTAETFFGSPQIVIGVLDQGIQLTHQDLEANIWTNPFDTANGVDDDANGCIDDIHGCNFRLTTPNGTVFSGQPSETHATHVAGIAGAVGNNNKGISGVNWAVGLMSLKFLDETGGGDTAKAIAALQYVKQMRELWISTNGTRGANIRVVNASFGGGGFSQLFEDAINEANGSGILFVAAAGNADIGTTIPDNDRVPHYPSSFSAPNIIAVAATNQSDQLPNALPNLQLFTTHFGATSVDLAAPGVSILSTTPPCTIMPPDPDICDPEPTITEANGDSYSVFSGTSMAAPHVSGAAALLWAKDPNLTVQQVKRMLMFGGDAVAGLVDKILSGRRLNVNGSVQSVVENDSIDPGAVVNFHLNSQTGRTLNVGWTAAGDDLGGGGNAALYELSFTDSAPGSTPIVLKGVVPASPGSAQVANVDIPYRHTTGTLTLREFDNKGNEGSPQTLNVNILLSVGDPYLPPAVGAPASLSIGGNRLNLNADDVLVDDLFPPGFNFPFFGTPHTGLVISSNGALYFSDPPHREDPLEADDVPSSPKALSGFEMIAGLWDDLDLRTLVRADAGVYVLQPNANTRIYRWQAKPCNFNGSVCTGGADVNFEIELRTDGTIKTRYGSGNTGLFPTVGIGGGGPESYVATTHTSEEAPIDLTNAGEVTFTPRALVTAPTIQFSQATYSVGENGTSVNVTVTRSGDTSGTVTVGYTTTDTDNFTVNCATFTGNAFARCDFATSVDTLTFAPGETSKSFLIPIINDVWNEGNETFGVTLSNVTAATLGTPATAQITITNDDTGTPPNPYFATPFFVRQHYLDFLSREPEPTEPWSAILNGCPNVNNDPSCDRVFVSGAIFGSPEFQLKGYYNYRFYKLAFNRLPLYEEIVVDMRKVTGITQQDTFQRRAQFANDFVLRQEFINQYNALGNTAYVNTLMNRFSLSAITTRDPNSPEAGAMLTLTTTDLINALNASTWTRAQVLRAIAESQQVFNQEFIPGFVAMQYYGYLRRIPDAGGYNQWLTYMNAHQNDFRTMVNGFMNSDEYRKRFGPNPDNP